MIKCPRIQIRVGVMRIKSQVNQRRLFGVFKINIHLTITLEFSNEIMHGNMTIKRKMIDY